MVIKMKDEKLYQCYLNVCNYDLKLACEFYDGYKDNGYESYLDTFEMKARETIGKFEVLAMLCTDDELGNKIDEQLCKLYGMLDECIG